MDDSVKQILDDYGWQVDCESPLEISLMEEAESQASGRAADIVVDYLVEEWHNNVW